MRPACSSPLTAPNRSFWRRPEKILLPDFVSDHHPANTASQTTPSQAIQHMRELRGQGLSLRNVARFLSRRREDCRAVQEGKRGKPLAAGRDIAPPAATLGGYGIGIALAWLISGLPLYCRRQWRWR
jgi:hypothetical protein